MCGIAGIVTAGANDDELGAEVARMVEVLGHRGPDHRGVEAGEGWALGMCRLAIQDLTEAGNQPMSRHGLTIVFNGEVYNFRTLRRELERLGHSFHSGSDTEVVLAAYSQWGAAAFARFNGMFAIAILDRDRRTLTLARDRFGKKPLFLMGDDAGRLIFGSELKALLAVMRRPPSLDRRALAEFFSLQYVPAPRSILEGVEKLPPATWREFSLDGGPGRQERFWSLPTSGIEGREVQPDEVLEAVRRSVGLRLVADVPVGCFLSGGTDSSLVSACMAGLVPGARTFSIGFADARYDESRYALAVARQLGTKHTHHVLEPPELLNSLPAFAHAYDEPFADSSSIPTMAVARLARRHVTVALSGDGGDEFFGGYTRYRYANILRAARAVPAVWPLTRLASVSRPPRRLGLMAQLVAARSQGAAYQSIVSIWRPHELRRLMPGVTTNGFVANAFDAAEGGVVERMMRADAQTYLVEDILQKVDRASMSVSLEARNPLLDPEVVALGLRAASLTGRDPGGKRLLRDALRLVLPDELVDRPKMGFGVPVGQWMRGPLRELVEDLVLSARGVEYDTATARAVTRAHLKGHDHTPQVWSLLVLELWREAWLKSAARVPS